MTFSFRIHRMSIHKQVLKFVTSLYLKVDFTLVTPRIQLDIISSPLKFMLKVLIYLYVGQLRESRCNLSGKRNAVKFCSLYSINFFYCSLCCLSLFLFVCLFFFCFFLLDSSYFLLFCFGFFFVV